jgi:uncharacterized protein
VKAFAARRGWLIALALILPALAALAEVAVPELNARVTDLTKTLSAAERAALEQRLAAFEARRGAQIAVLLVPTTQPETIEQYAIRVAERWKIGRRGIDDGVLLIVALKDRTVRLEVGYGLEGALPDALARRVIDERIVPRFSQGDFYGGLDAGVSHVIALIEGEALPPPGAGRGPRERDWEALLVIAFMLVFVVGGILRAVFGRFVGSGVIGGLGGAAGWLMLGSLALALVIGILAFVLSLIGSASAVPGRRGGWYSGRRGGPWGTGGYRGGGFGGWGGGGGGFGGGGASGRW